MRLALERKGDVISLLPSFSRGGEGSIHPIANEPGLVAKVFTQPSPERAEKLRAMIDNPPVLGSNTPVLLAWPLDRLLTASGECVGYVMPYAKDKETLSTVYLADTRPKWADYRFLLSTAKNVAIAVSALHRHGYVVGDIKESNILVGPDASVALVDTDSVQVRTTTQEVFRCEVGTPEFTPPELIQAGQAFRDFDRYQHHDAFGLAVLIFLLLMDGNHPFDTWYLGPGTRPSKQERIAQGLWPYSKMCSPHYRPRREAPPIESLSPEIQRLMRECFESGHKNPVCRPTPDDWCKAITEAEAEWDSFPAQFRHFYYRKLNGREFGRILIETYQWLRPAVERVPRKVWAAILGATGIFLLILLCLSFASSSEPGPKGPDGRPITGERTPRLWRDVQSQHER